MFLVFWLLGGSLQTVVFRLFQSSSISCCHPSCYSWRERKEMKCLQTLSMLLILSLHWHSLLAHILSAKTSPMWLNAIIQSLTRHWLVSCITTLSKGSRVPGDQPAIWSRRERQNIDVWPGASVSPKVNVELETPELANDLCCCFNKKNRGFMKI